MQLSIQAEYAPLILISPLLKKLRPKQLLIITRLYGLDKKESETYEQLAERLNKSVLGIQTIEINSLTKLGIAIDPEGFFKMYYSGDTRKELERKNRALWRYLKDNGLLMAPRRRNYEGNPIGLYNAQCKGITRGRLPYVNNALYQALKYHKQLYLVPTIEKLL